MFAVVGTVLAVAETSAGRLAGGVLGWLLLRSVGIRVRLASTSHLGVFRYNPYIGITLIMVRHTVNPLVWREI